MMEKTELKNFSTISEYFFFTKNIISKSESLLKIIRTDVEINQEKVLDRFQSIKIQRSSSEVEIKL